MRILNLYVGIGGNRKLWKDVEVTAVELNPKIAAVYKKLFPNDIVIVCDAHQYLLDHHQEFDFIWSSPPCQSHSRTNYFLKGKGIYRYPDLKLYEEILFLKHFFKGKWCVENVISYYNPLMPPQVIGRHYLWSNFIIPPIRLPKDEIGCMNGPQKANKIPLEERNAVNPKLGLHILKCAFRIHQEVLIK